MNLKNDLLIRAAEGKEIERYPVWLMRQAGRILPEYRAVRSRLSGFKELVETPELAAEVTIQPVNILATDAAIIFSDILVVPEAMGLHYQMLEAKGPWFEKTIRSKEQFHFIDQEIDVADRLSYVFEAIRLTKIGLDGKVPLIGFAGAPFTIFCYMVEGQGSKTFSIARKMLYENPSLAHQLLEQITAVTIPYLQLQIKAGANLLQLFDSWAGILGKEQYEEFGLKYIEQLTANITEVPITVFAKGAHQALPNLAKMNCQTIGVDWNLEMDTARKMVGNNKTLQGNLDPCALYASHKEIENKTKKMLHSFENKRHIVNLGHGVYPDTDPEKVKTFIQCVKNYTL
jgi:uroporphyrinogen decarboxylase